MIPKDNGNQPRLMQSTFKKSLLLWFLSALVMSIAWPTLARADQSLSAHWTNAPLEQILDFYALLSKRTVLHPTLPKLSFTVNATAPDSAKMTAAIEQALEQKHLSVISDGDKFVRVIKEEDLRKDELRAAQLKSTPARFPQVVAPPTGTADPADIDISFPDVNLLQVVDFISFWSKAKALRRM